VKIFFKLTFLLTICLSLNFTSHAFAGVHEKLINKYIELSGKYIELSGLDQMLSTFPDQIDAMFSQKILTSEQPEFEKKVATIMKESFDIVLVKENLNFFLLHNTDINFLENLIKRKSFHLPDQVHKLNFFAILQTYRRDHHLRIASLSFKK